jgi:hypothetical protein
MKNIFAILNIILISIGVFTLMEANTNGKVVASVYLIILCTTIFIINWVTPLFKNETK